MSLKFGSQEERLDTNINAHREPNKRAYLRNMYRKWWRLLGKIYTPLPHPEHITRHMIKPYDMRQELPRIPHKNRDRFDPEEGNKSFEYSVTLRMVDDGEFTTRSEGGSSTGFDIG